MRSLTSVDLLAIMKELKGLEGSKVDRIQCIGDEVRLRLYKKEKQELVIKAGAGLWLTRYAKEAPKEPSNICMLMRKHIGNAKVKSISQLGFDRIAKIEFDNGCSLIAELFSKGNIIFCKDGEILHALRFEEWKGRSIKPKRAYVPPPQSKNLLAITQEEFGETLKKSSKDLVRTLVMDLNLAGTYAEEACHLAGIEKGKKAGGLTEEESKKIFERVRSILEKAPLAESPQIAKGTAVPFTLATLGEGKRYSTFNEAVDDYLTTAEGADESRQAECLKKKKTEKIKAKLAEQEKAAGHLLRAVEENRKRGELIKKHAHEIESLLGQARKKVKEHGTEGIKDTSTNGIKITRILPEEQKIVVEIDET